MHPKVQLIPSIRSRVMTGTKFGYIHTYIHTYIFLKPIILNQEPQKHRNSSKSLIRKFSPLQSFLFEKAKLDDSKEYVCKVKGIRLNYSNSKKINFDTIRKMIELPDSEIVLSNTVIRRTVFHEVLT